MVNDREFILTRWDGLADYVKANGSRQVLLDTRQPRVADHSRHFLASLER